MLRREAVRRLGLPVLDAINGTGQVPAGTAAGAGAGAEFRLIVPADNGASSRPPASSMVTRRGDIGAVCAGGFAHASRNLCGQKARYIGPRMTGFPVYSGGRADHAARMKKRNVARPLSTNAHLLRWVEKMAALCQPARLHWVDGSAEENHALCEQLVASGTFTKLNPKLWPGCYYARSDPNDVARVEDRTFICSLDREAAGPTNNWVNPYEMRRKLRDLFAGCMAGRTMYVLPFSMGPVGGPM